MTTPPSPKFRPLQSRAKVAVTTAALPVVVLSSLALAQPAEAQAPSQPYQKIPATLKAAMEAQAAAAKVQIPSAKVASTVPSALRPMASVPGTYTIKSGDTISGIAARYGLKTSEVLRINNLRATQIIYPGQKIKLSGTATAAAPVKTTAPKPTAIASTSGTYTVKSGDTLGGIAGRHGVSLSSLFSANGLSMSSIIYPGQKIRLSGSAASTPAAVKPAASKPAASKPATTTGTYTVKSGDTLGGIAGRHGVSLSSLLSANGLSMSSIIYPGQKIRLSGSVASTPTAVQPAGGTTTPLVPSSFLGYHYPAAVVSSANANKALLNAAPVPSQAQMKEIVRSTAVRMGVDPKLAMAFAYQESGFNQRAVSPANAIGTMQVIPSSGEWASSMVGRKLNLLDPYDNVTAGVALIRSLLRTSKNTDYAIAGYYQGQYSVELYGMYSDTKAYVAAIKAHRATF
ncbi:LysM peptidoglycan-binding domain-containing protein [Pseudarthrobacter sp. J1738]|uniref:lytic transglycosylase n=1 Tax=unclassified Pseudarthrobacter TaxID=2647000 RepID=UPI003D2CD60D